MQERKTKLTEFVEHIKRKTWSHDLPAVAIIKYPSVAAEFYPQASSLATQQPEVDQDQKKQKKETNSTSQKIMEYMKKKVKPAEWSSTNQSHEYLFGSSPKGKANLRALLQVMVRHHLWKIVGGRRIFSYAPLCSIHACGGLCPNGLNCPDLHRLRGDFYYNSKDKQLHGQDARKKIDEIFKNAKK